MLKSKNTKRQFKGIDILYSIEQDLESWSTIMYLVFQKDDLEEMMEPEVTKEEGPALILDAEATKLANKTLKKKHATFELTLMQHVGGEVKNLLQRNLAEVRQNTKKANGYEAWNALLQVFKGAGSSTKAKWQQLLFDFKMPSPATKTNLTKGLKEYENILSKLRELNVNVDTSMLAIKLASSLPREDTSCRIVHTNTMQMPNPTVRTVIGSVEQLISQFECDEYTTELEPADQDEQALYNNDNLIYCKYHDKNGNHTEANCYINPNNKNKSNSKMIQKGIDKGMKAFFVARTANAKKQSDKKAKATAAKKAAQVQKTNFESGFFADESSSDNDSDNSTYFEYAFVSKFEKHHTSTSHKNDDWLADSGATSNMTHSSAELYNIVPILGQRVTVGNGNYLDILCRGTLDFLNKAGRRVTLSDVLYVPGLHVNLVSIGKLQQRGLTTTFQGSSSSSKNEHAYIKNKKGRRLLSATLVDSLYKMDMKRVPKSSSEAAFPTISLNVLHQRLAHLPFKKIRSMKQTLVSQNICISKTTEQCPCMGCAKGKLHRANVRKTRRHPATEPLEVIHTDLSGPYETTKQGNRWMLLFIDEFTRHTTMYPLKKKNDALTSFIEYKKYIENDRKRVIQSMSMSSIARDTILRLQSDGGGEYKSNKFATYLSTHGIQHFTSNADNPSQNGIAERYIRTVSEAGLSMLTNARLSDKYWPYAMRSAVYILNRIPKTVLGNVSPYERWTGTSPDLSTLRTFGVDAHVRVVTQEKRKGGDKAHPCTFLGYREGLKGYIFESKKTQRIVTNGDAVFYEGDWLINGIKRFDFETPLCTRPTSPPPLLTKYHVEPPPLATPGLPPTNIIMTPEGEGEPDQDNDAVVGSDHLVQGEISSSDSSAASSSDDNNSDDDECLHETPHATSIEKTTSVQIPTSDLTKDNPAPSTNIPNMVATTGRNVTFAPTPPVFNTTTMRMELENIPSTIRPRRDPATYEVDYNRRQRMTQSPSPSKQKKTSHATSSSSRNRTKPACIPNRKKQSKTPSTRTYIPERALSVQAMHADGIHVPTTLRAALESPQNTLWKKAMQDEIKSLHDNSVLGPTLDKLPPGRKSVSSKWVFAIKRDEKGIIIRYKARLVARGFTQRQGIDYDRTFAPVMKQSLLRAVLAEANNADWDIEQIDIKTAFLYGEIDEEIYLKLPDGNMHLLERALYGLKQAGRQWYHRFNKSLEGFGLKRLHGDPCCYHMKTETETLIVMIHVDDAIITGTHPATIRSLKTALRKEYELKDMGPIKHCLGWEITRDRKRRLLTISQRQYIVDLLNTYHVKPTTTKSCPASNIILTPKGEGEEKLEHPYMELLGAVLYIANSTRPDISYSVSELSRYSSNPSTIHWQELKRILHYLNETQNHGLVFRGEMSPLVHGFVDASYARCPVTRKSRHGAVLLHSGGAIDWRSKMQTVVATSSMEAEYIGLCAIVKMSKWIQTCMVELHLSRQTKIIIGMDNQSAMIFAEEQIVQDRSKHIDIKFHYIREQIQKGLIELEYVPTNRLPADALTKPLPQTKLRIFRKEMGIHPVLRPSANTSLEGSVGIQTYVDPVLTSKP